MPTRSVDSVVDFHDFYLASRRRLVLSAYALTGDLAAARTAVGDAFVLANIARTDLPAHRPLPADSELV